MSIWFILWFLLSTALLFFAGWTLLIMVRQRDAWRVFAKKHKLRYSVKKNFMAPEINGAMNDYTISLFTSEHQAADMRGVRKMSAIEVSLKSRLPFSGAVGNGSMVPIIQNLAYKNEVKPATAGWQASYVARAENAAALNAYLNDDRLGALIALMKSKASASILIFTPEEALLRFDTPDPLDQVDKIEALVKKVIDAAKILELKEGEAARLKMAVDKPKDTGTKTLHAPEVTELQLED